MIKLKTLSCTVAAASLAFSSMAYAGTTQSVNMLPKASVAERATAPVQDASQLEDGDGVSGWIIALLAAAAAIGGIVILSGSDTPG